MIYKKVNGTMKEIKGIHKKVNGTMKEVIKIMKKVNGTMKEVYKKKGVLPSDYQAVEYIESSDLQYIDTNFKYSSDNIIVECGFKKHTTTTGSIFGNFTNSDYYKTGVGTYFTSSNIGNFYLSNLDPTPYTFPYNEYHDWKFTVSGNTSKTGIYTLHKDGVFIGGGNGVGEIEKTLNVALFCQGSSTGFIGKTSCQIRYFRVKENNILKLDLVACYNKNTNVNGFYDLVSGNFLTNAGSGVFSRGNDI